MIEIKKNQKETKFFKKFKIHKWFLFSFGSNLHNLSGKNA